MKRPDITPGEWLHQDNLVCALNGKKSRLRAKRMHLSVQRGIGNDCRCISEQEQVATARAIAALPDLLAALETALVHSTNDYITAAARAALTKAGYTFDDSTTP